MKKIDFDLIDRIVAAGAPAAAIVEMWKAYEGKKTAKRTKERNRQRTKRTNNEQQVATNANIEQQSPTRDERERQFYIDAKAVLGKNSGGLIASLLKAKHQDLETCQRVLDIAKTKADTREYFAAACRSNGYGRTGDNRPSLAAVADELIEKAAGLERAYGIARSDDPGGGAGGGQTIDGTVAERETG